MLGACSDDSEQDKAADPESVEVTKDGLASVEEVTACLTSIGLDAEAIGQQPPSLTEPAKGLQAALESEAFDDQGVAFWIFETAEAAEANRLQITLAPIETPSSFVSKNLIVRFTYPPQGDEPWAQDVRDCAALVTS